MLIPYDASSLRMSITRVATAKTRRRTSKWKLASSAEAVCHCQIVRSVSTWSAGVATENSIHSAYIDLIRKAKHFIYIEVCILKNSNILLQNNSKICVESIFRLWI